MLWDVRTCSVRGKGKIGHVLATVSAPNAMCACVLVIQSCPNLCTPWTVAHHSLSMEFSRQAYWSGLPFPSPRNLPDPGTEPGSPALQADSLPSEPPGSTQLCGRYALSQVMEWYSKLCAAARGASPKKIQEQPALMETRHISVTVQTVRIHSTFSTPLYVASFQKRLMNFFYPILM